MHEINSTEIEAKSSVAKPAASQHTAAELMTELRLQRELLSQNHDLLRSIRRSQRAATAFSALRTMIWLIPLAIGLIYLPPLLKKASESWQQLQQVGSSASGLPKGLDLQALQDILQKSGLLER